MPRSHPQRKPCRLAGHNYGQAGFYFLTLVTRDRACLFGEILSGEMILGPLGAIARATWEETPAHCPQARLDTFVVMPNHLHAIVILVGATHASPCRIHHGRNTGEACLAPTRWEARRGTLGTIVGAFKSASAKRINEARGTPGGTVWQRGYFDHIIRDTLSLDRIRRYIRDNPIRWSTDREHPPSGVRRLTGAATRP